MHFSATLVFVRELTRISLQYFVFTTIKLPTTSSSNCGSSGDFREMPFFVVLWPRIDWAFEVRVDAFQDWDLGHRLLWFSGWSSMVGVSKTDSILSRGEV